MKRATVHAAHKVPDRTPIQVYAGQEVAVGERDDEWPEFVFVTTTAGSGWVPARNLTISGPGGQWCAPPTTPPNCPPRSATPSTWLSKICRAAGSGAGPATATKVGSPSAPSTSKADGTRTRDTARLSRRSRRLPTSQGARVYPSLIR
jgi:hypothetical protein